MVALGGFAWNNLLRVLGEAGWSVPRPKVAFAHAAEAIVRRTNGTPVALLASYHPSQQNTFTGTLSEEMFDRVWARARELLRETP
jgi:uracil-DNA glycosylase